MENCPILSLHQKRDRYQNEYELKQDTFFRLGKMKSVNSLNCVQELYAMSANLFGLDEQLYYLDNIKSKGDQVEFINNLSELQLSNDLVEDMYKRRDYNTILDHFGSDIKNEMMNRIMSKNAKRFVQVLAQFIDKRNAYRRKQKDNLLVELVSLKTLLIKHYCIMQKISMYK
ncbi:pkip [Sucra jujuba nucleopolyhedrovirus]|uniref:Pkip n=1 Tax=Sucra jujuba nucleopolyhedrovirus TaxID=1563660 RepID=A0A097P940_9ABAC|nr:pkip [Sucra jujuba nucleopolyhedrovirus]AIU41350.1 pkip [Sucra jujuba nucleopolyhedrovirus]